ncbi:MAG TPA: SgcJ/EcaC family oxidoreductase [Rhizomicrobium sp.]|jgi:uncharacterized protein (TIGR02246 family)|nr:SgcJ/EcaC family oxidoreductase [Rhizomicrobium sp.]
MTISDDERAIRALVDDWMDASRAGDLHKVLSLMAEDVLFTVQGQAPFGKEAYRAMAAGMKPVQMEGSADILELEIRGDWAWLRNYLDMTVTPPDGPPVRRTGYTLSILRKEPDGRWLLFRDANLVS